MPEQAAENNDEERELTPEEIEALLGQQEEVSPEARDEPAPADAPSAGDEAASGDMPLQDLASSEGEKLVSPENLLDFLGDVPLEITIELGRARLTIGELISLREGSIVELDKIAGEPVDIFANGKLIARGEIIVVNDYFSVRITDIVSEDSDTA